MKKETPRFFRVAVPSSAREALTYACDPSGATLPERGTLVKVNVRGRTKVGVVLEPADTPSFTCKPLEGSLFLAPQLPEVLLELLQWVSRYYLCPLPRLVHLAAPGIVWKAAEDETRAARFQKYAGDATELTSKKSLEHLPFALRGEPNLPQVAPSRLTDEQAAALARIEQASGEGFVATVLLGVTGSGKTEVYLELARRTLERGKNVLILVPEVALTPQMTGRFRQAFGQLLAVTHSGLSTRETEREWYRVVCGQARVVLGVRRGVFSPLADIGLIVVDEEHDGSYKADEFPCFHARDVAIKRAQLLGPGTLCVLGSASPSLESMANVQAGRFALAELKSRLHGHFPQIEVLDSRHFMRTVAQGKLGSERSTGYSFDQCVILPQVLLEIERTVARGEQVMVIVNRRGYTNFAICLDCGEPLKCRHCDVSTTLHNAGRFEVCHHCGHREAARVICPSCGSQKLETRGFGTQLVEEELSRSLPNIRLGRLDRDILTSPSRLLQVLESFRMGKTDVLIGTQILSKGHDFPKVSLVCVLHLEDSLFLPDFRSAERTFQLLLQSAGRAGRGELMGRVLVQSLQPDHEVLRAIFAQQSERFYEHELELRRLAGLPPFRRMVLIELGAKKETQLERDALDLRRLLLAHLHRAGLGERQFRLVGPHPAPVERIGGVWRCHLSLSVEKSIHPCRVVPADLHADRFGESRLRVDIDPFRFM